MKVSEEGTYFEVTTDDDYAPPGLARPVNHDFSFSRLTREAGRMTNVPDLRWSWPHRTHRPGDIVGVSDGVRVISPVMKDILDSHRTSEDEIQWVPATVVDPEGRALPHWVPHFPQQLDLYDHEQSTFGPNGLPIRYVLSASKLASHAVTIMGAKAMTFVLAERVVDDLKNAGCIGLMYMKLPIAA